MRKTTRGKGLAGGTAVAAVIAGLAPVSYTHLVKIVGLEVEGGEGEIEISPAHSQSDQQIGQDLTRLAGWCVQLLFRISTQNSILLCPAEAADRNRNDVSIPVFRSKSNQKEKTED